MKFKVYVTTSEIPESAIDILETTSDVVVNKEPGPPSREILLREVEDAFGVLCLLTERMDKEVMQTAHKLKVIANMAVGYDNVDLNEATMRSIRVTNNPEVLTETTADLAMAIILAVARRIPEADHYVRTGKWVVPWSPMMMVGSDVHGKILGIYGPGRIGKAVARRARGFGMR